VGRPATVGIWPPGLGLVPRQYSLCGHTSRNVAFLAAEQRLDDARILVGQRDRSAVVSAPRDRLLQPDTVRVSLIENEDRSQAPLAFEWATLFALSVALRNGSVYAEHSFDFRSQATLLIPDVQRSRRAFAVQHTVPQPSGAWTDARGISLSWMTSLTIG
jgi:hypothetical protein